MTLSTLELGVPFDRAVDTDPQIYTIIVTGRVGPSSCARALKLKYLDLIAHDFFES